MVEHLPSPPRRLSFAEDITISIDSKPVCKQQNNGTVPKQRKGALSRCTKIICSCSLERIKKNLRRLGKFVFFLKSLYHQAKLNRIMCNFVPYSNAPSKGEERISLTGNDSI